MNILFGLTLTLILVPGHTGLARRRYRELGSAADLSQKEIPVHVLEIQPSESLPDPVQKINDAALKEATQFSKTETVKKRVSDSLTQTSEEIKNLESDPEISTDNKQVQPLNNLFASDAAPPASDEVGQKGTALLPSEEILSSIRQATQAPQPQTSTQQNFVQQLIQPLGQFISQFTGGQQSQQQLTGEVANVEPANPGPTLPGFLNPTAAITSAQQAVQNVVNSTTQAFQGLQQLASNIGTSFQNTLSNLGSQPNENFSSTSRPPGPIQSIVSNLIGGNQPSAEPPQGPLQGIISFFQGGNRPQSTVPTTAITTSQPPKLDEATSVSVVIGGVTGIDDKIGNSNQVHDVEEDANNEVRQGDGEKVGEDSFEDSQFVETIVVNDDTKLQEGSHA